MRTNFHANHETHITKEQRNITFSNFDRTGLSSFDRTTTQAIINLAFLDFVGKAPGGKPEIHLVDFSGVIEVSQRKVSFLNRVLKGGTDAFNA